MEVGPIALRGVPRQTPAVERFVSPTRDEGLAAVWPRRFDLDSVKALLGDSADLLLCDVLARRVNAPLWTLADRGGRKWRPTVSRLAFLASGGVPPAPEAICQVAELLHTGSLIVDDIQDDATERRGGPAAHVIYGVPTALNAANTAYFRALELLRRALPSTARLRALDMLAEELFAAHLGQALDLALGAEVQRRPVPSAHYVVLARAKTGALVRIAARLGAIAADADPAVEAALGEWASEVGVAYQIRNDLDDLANGMHDVAAARPTYPLLLVLEHDGPAAATLRRHLGRPAPTGGEARVVRRLFARERVVERADAAAAQAIERALHAIRSLPAIAFRTELERLTCELAGDSMRA
jgi:geranylgeranyl diphosphate synthase type I